MTLQAWLYLILFPPTVIGFIALIALFYLRTVVAIWKSRK